jgi:glycosyltransferase involved in cell wall biosynthesis
LNTGASVLIPARDAEHSLAKALESAFQVETSAIFVADHGSTDKTLQVAQNYSKMQVRTIDASSCKNIAEVRQTLIDHSNSVYSVWLDADDELLPGRVKRIVGSLEKNHADLYFDASELVQGNRTKTLPMPNFASSNPEAHCRNFERCFLPAPGVPGVRTEFAKKIGFDPDFETAEDYDFLLRASMSGGKFCFDPRVGYRQHHTPNSLSRNLEQQTAFTSLALRKHSLEKISRLYQTNGWNERIQRWGIIQITTFLHHYSTAIDLVNQLEEDLGSPDSILEPAGIYPYPEIWMINFWKGTLYLLQGSPEISMNYLSKAKNIMSSPETLNNLGVCTSLLNNPALAKNLFKEALTKKENYFDARENLKAKHPKFITKLPLRHFITRSSYF